MYEDAKCPCGGKKPCMTLLCDECLAAMKNHPSMAVFKDMQQPTLLRHHAAMVLVTLSKNRKSTPTTKGS